LLLSSDSNSDAVIEVANKVVGFAMKLIEGEFLSVAIDRALNEAPKLCPHSPHYVENYKNPVYSSYEVTSAASSPSLITGVLILIGSLIVTVAAICLFTKIIVRRRHRKWLDSISDEQALLVLTQQTAKKERETYLNVSTTSLVASESIPLWVRLIMPIVILGNIGFFLSGHINLGASVTILISLGGETLRSDDFFSFSMAKSTIEIWNGTFRDYFRILPIKFSKPVLNFFYSWWASTCSYHIRCFLCLAVLEAANHASTLVCTNQLCICLTARKHPFVA
jgi:hypothetical protein